MQPCRGYGYTVNYAVSLNREDDRCYCVIAPLEEIDLQEFIED